MFEIVFYEKENQSKPAKEFILSMNPKMRARALRQIDLLKRYGNLLREPDSKYLRDGIFELRIQQGNDITRILYFFYHQGKIVLTNGFFKKTQKTPAKEIEKAIEFKDDFKRRMGNG